jgi:glycerol-3-phosphate responsive antiterminator
VIEGNLLNNVLQKISLVGALKDEFPGIMPLQAPKRVEHVEEHMFHVICGGLVKGEPEMNVEDPGVHGAHMSALRA